MTPRTRTPRKILVASLGVATMTYVMASCGGGEVVANLVGPTPESGPPDGKADTRDEFPVANLVAIPMDAPADVTKDAVGDTRGDSPRDAFTIDEFPVANLVAIPIDGGH